MPFDGEAKVTFVISLVLMLMLPRIWSNINIGSWSMTFPGGKTALLVAAYGVNWNKSLIAQAATG